MKHLWFDRLERTLGFISIPGLASFIVGMNAIIWILTLLRPEFPTLLVLDPGLVLQGQVWRLFTFLFIPPPMHPLWMFFWLFLFYTFAQALEHEWGDFHFTLFYLLGALGTIIASLIFGKSLSNMTLNTTLFFAFAALYPDFELLLFFFLPVKVKWIAYFMWANVLWSFFISDAIGRLSLAAGLVNYVVFFGPGHWQSAKLKIHSIKNKKRFR